MDLQQDERNRPICIQYYLTIPKDYELSNPATERNTKKEMEEAAAIFKNRNLFDVD